MRYAVYEYGCLSPIAGEELALEQMRRRIDFWNALVTLEQEHIARTREVLRVPDIDDHIAKLRADIPEMRSQRSQGYAPSVGLRTARTPGTSGAAPDSAADRHRRGQTASPANGAAEEGRTFDS